MQITRPAALCSQVRQAERERAGRPGASSSSNAASSCSSVISDAVPGGGPPEFQTTMSMPPNACSVRVDEPLEIGGVRHVTSYGERAEPVRLALELLAAAGEHRHVRALVRERLGRGEPETGRGSADDRRPAAQTEIHRRDGNAARASRCRRFGVRSRYVLRTDDDVADGVGRLAERRLLRLVEVDLEDLLDPLRAELHRHAHVEAVDAVLALEVGRARAARASRRAGSSRPSAPHAAPGAYQAEVPSSCTSSPPPLAVRSTIAAILLLGDELADRHAADRRRGDDGDHLVAVAAEHDALRRP